MTTISFETRCLSSLAKVFADGEFTDSAFIRGSSLRNEVYSFQVAYRSDHLMHNIRLHVHSPLREWITISTVGLAPSELPAYADHDEDILRSTPGLYPDPLYPINEEEGIRTLPRQWRSLWVMIETNGQAVPGLYPVEVAFETTDGHRLGEARFELEIIEGMLPEQRLIHTEWFYVDCLATQYRVEMFGEEHWRIIENYVELAVRRGINMILTPLFTPPLETSVGKERPTNQLVDVDKSGDQYRFGFDKLKKWVELCQGKGVRYFEFSHLFTQWGAKHAPKIIATENEETKPIFGWETDAVGEEYKNFLSQFLPELVTFIKEHGLESKSYFHISDEPNSKQLEDYRQAKEIVITYLQEFPIIDALSDYDFYRQGVITNPVPSNDHIAPFLENGVPDLWTYYCCGQYKRVSNRFFNMPSSRNRITGIQLYKFDIAGFLHWGYNHWYSRRSLKQLNPYQVTDADCGFPSGDAFLVYPGEDGRPISSIRFEVLHDALQDMRAFQLLESFIGKAKVMEMLEEGLKDPISFDTYPKEQAWLLEKREQINQKIKELSK
ncbi:protein of unknown function [Paenibacillus sp. yr247]|uniref:DUF4091 domain-containing protein n=1 Tax=Paenibacillus sp. yr247 TaxID=1761880 RepID=UPI000881C959|nr:DUF4091 domain-containing protein [Paenibacillus sp. yr247]SDN97250.1 protein of unknown function [Paenibacillus sp. yr247]